MIRNIGNLKFLIYFQTLNRCEGFFFVFFLIFLFSWLNWYIYFKIYINKWRNGFEYLVGHVSGKQDWRFRMNWKLGVKQSQSKYTQFRYHEGYWFILTAGRWPRKLESAKKCVTTYLPNGSVPKMDVAWV